MYVFLLKREPVSVPVCQWIVMFPNVPIYRNSVYIAWDVAQMLYDIVSLTQLNCFTAFYWDNVAFLGSIYTSIEYMGIICQTI